MWHIVVAAVALVVVVCDVVVIVSLITRIRSICNSDVCIIECTVECISNYVK